MSAELYEIDIPRIYAILIKTGFVEAQEMLKTGYNIFPSDGPATSDVFYLESNSDTLDIYHRLMFLRNDFGDLDLHSIRSTYQYPTELNETGVNLISYEYDRERTGIPTKSEIEEWLALAVQKEQVYERVLTDGILRNELLSLGFLDVSKMFRTSQRHAGLVFLQTSRPLEWPPGLQEHLVHFQFAVHLGKDGQFPHIVTMKATLVPSSGPSDLLSIERVYSQSTGGIPSQRAAVEDLKESISVKREEFDRLVKAYGFASNLSINKSPIEQLKLKI